MNLISMNHVKYFTGIYYVLNFRAIKYSSTSQAFELMSCNTF